MSGGNIPRGLLMRRTTCTSFHKHSRSSVNDLNMSKQLPEMKKTVKLLTYPKMQS